MIKLTQRQREVLDFVTLYIQQHGVPPTRAEMAKALGFKSVNAAEDHLKALARKGMIDILPGLSRGLRLRQCKGLPVVGHLTLGNPILAENHIVEYCTTDNLFQPRADYLIRVQGHAMRDAGILEHDLLAIHRTPAPTNGQIVVAMLNQEVLIRRYERIHNSVRLISANSDVHPLTVDMLQHHLEIDGVAVGLIRRYDAHSRTQED